VVEGDVEERIGGNGACKRVCARDRERSHGTDP
jgi:hypothetical protein